MLEDFTLLFIPLSLVDLLMIFVVAIREESLASDLQGDERRGTCTGQLYGVHVSLVCLRLLLLLLSSPLFCSLLPIPS